jgi:hypothetical protein
LPGGTAPTITFDPANIPKRHTLLIAPGQPSADDAAALEAHHAHGNNSGNTGSGAASSDGNHVVRLHPGGGEIRTYSGADNHVVRMYCP